MADDVAKREFEELLRLRDEARKLSALFMKNFQVHHQESIDVYRLRDSQMLHHSYYPQWKAANPEEAKALEDRFAEDVLARGEQAARDAERRRDEAIIQVGRATGALKYNEKEWEKYH